MLHAVTIDPIQRPFEPPDLVARLATRGVRLLDGRRYLLLDAPAELLTAAEWPELESACQRCGAALQNLAVLMAITRADTSPRQLVERILELPAPCFPILVEALGGPGGVEVLAARLESEAHLDLCFAAYLQALTFQVAHGLGGEDEEGEERENDEERPDGEPDC